LQSAWMRS